ncbi:hypothetical protein AHAS_Ahas04G0188100 [Arachis hypogaea]
MARRAGMRVVNEGRVQELTDRAGALDDGIAEESELPHLDRLEEKAASLGADRGEEADVQGRGRTTKGEDDRISKEAQVKENEVTLALEVEFGTVLYDEKVDIMSILQAHNEEIAEKQKLSK